MRRRPQSTKRSTRHRKSLAIVVLALVTSCELLFMGEVPGADPRSIFEQAWRFVDTEYSFFELKGIDWDGAHETYADMIRSDMSDEELFDLIAEMLYLLEDGHVNLRSSFDYSRNWRWFLDYPENFDYQLLERSYFDEEERFVGPFVVFDFGDIVYARYASFSYSFGSEHLDYLFGEFETREGFILDVRSNGGGFASNAYRIAERLVSGATEVGSEQFKNGPGHEDFTELTPTIIEPPADAIGWHKPMAILTNRSSYSATNLLVALATNLPHVTIVGDTTGGGGGIPSSTELSNGWILRVSAHRRFAEVPFQDEPYNIESGLPPDIDVDLDPLDLAAGIDSILEAALAHLR